MSNNTLEKRMKRYESVTDIYLMRRTPVILRMDGSHFHTFTRGLYKPFDNIFRQSMIDTMRDLCQSIQGAVFGYTQSDEISIVLVDYTNRDSGAWFNYRLGKMCSVGASMASRRFNKNFIFKAGVEFKDQLTDEEYVNYSKHFNNADFDCRAFNLPKEEVCNYLIWRQKDAERNSIQSLAQSMYSHKELIGKKNNELQNKMFTEKGVNWNDLPTFLKRGAACYVGELGIWKRDLEMPILTQDREYVERHVFIGE